MRAEFCLHLRIPPYAEGATIEVGDEPAQNADASEFTVIDRTWSPGDTVVVRLPLPLTAQASDDVVALTRGPLTYAYFQDAQADPMVFCDRRGLYPEDVVLTLDTAEPSTSCLEEAAPDGLIGPALTVPATLRARAPLFANVGANARISPASEERAVLLPFVNQGAVRGEYSVFMPYDSA